MRFRKLLFIIGWYLAGALCVTGADTVLRGQGSGQVIPPNSSVPEPLVVRIIPPSTDLSVRFSVISVPHGAEGVLLKSQPAGDTGSSEHLDVVPSASGEAQVWVRTGDQEGAYIITAKHPKAGNVLTFFVHARRPIWKYLMPVPVLGGLAMVIWGVIHRRRT